ncbi:related to transcription activator protein acu-15 [Phialocephala subalpina]|uniref:Related to transcription activator protein acu-15 n=1 Tax=Phialocephala subalpina TaxID=576137 RepID=A0A1L7X8J7_9HELO|nr:related to transcription activator protein acu-15 [Phialocephala subalpina]
MASTSENSSNQAENSSQPQKNSRQRFKPQLSCTFCRSRKLKCDRTMPCENCVKRNLAASCTYVHASLLKDKDKPQVQKSSSSQAPKDVQSQVRRLEELVISLMNKTNKNAGNGNQDHVTRPDQSPSSSDGIEVDEGEGGVGGIDGVDRGDRRLKDTALSFGRITIDEDERANYVGSAHWAAILDNIAGLKDQLDISDDPIKEEKDSVPEVPGPDLLVGSVRAATRAEILATLPPRGVVDKLLLRFFEGVDMGSSMLHRPTFMKEYDLFWQFPQTTPIMWIGQLFGICTLAVFYETISKAPSSLTGMPLQNHADAIDIYREKTIQCLVLGNYTDPGPCTLETLYLYYISAHFMSTDAMFGAWLVFALLIRTAMRLGYHRDASHYPNLSVFRGEMQRRLWASLVHMDLQTSLQVGLPRMIREGMYDTQPPRNLMDEDFGENTTVLPLPRPDHDMTAVGCANVKHRITKVLGMIVDQSNWTCPISYEMVMKLDKQLHDVYLRTPPSLRVEGTDDILHGTPIQRIRKVTLDLCFQKARCILHRRFFFPSKATGKYAYPYSMKSCIDASMRILHVHMLVHEETLPGRALYDHRWRTSSLMSQDFLLAGMLICLHIGHGITKSPADQGESQSGGIRVRWSHMEMVQALESSCKIWEHLAPSSKEAAKAVRTLRSMLARVAGSQQPSPADHTSSGSSSGVGSYQYISTPVTAGPDYLVGSTPAVQNAAEEPVLSSSWVPITSPSLQAPGGAGSDIQPSFDNNSGNMGGFDMMDWELWDSQAFNSSLGEAPTDLWNFDSSFNFVDPSLNPTMWGQQP